MKFANSAPSAPDNWGFCGLVVRNLDLKLRPLWRSRQVFGRFTGIANELFDVFGAMFETHSERFKDFCKVGS